MPRLRDALAQAEDAMDRKQWRSLVPESSLAFGTRETVWTRGTRVKHATLWWVSADMTELATAAAETLEVADPVAARPATVGLLVWDGGFGEGRDHLDAVSWAPSESGGIGFWFYRRVEHAGAPYTRSGMEPVTESRLVGEAKPGRIPEDRIVRTMIATWLLMMQPRLVEEKHLNRDTKQADPARRRGREVTIIQLRRPARDQTTDGRADREYDHRWIVRGHWRNQACGRRHSERRPVWVTPYVKGPEDAPLVTDRVHVWSR